MNQNTQHNMEPEHTQQTINVTDINLIPTKPNTDSFYNSWGNTLPDPKPAGTVCLALQNFGGWPQWNKHQKNKTIRQYLNENNINIFVRTENNVAWHKILPVQCLPEQMHRWCETSHLSIAHNKNDCYAKPYQLGGVAILSCNRVAHRIAGMGQDPTRLGRFCWTTYRGKQDLTVQILAGYRPCKLENGHMSVLQQHWWHQDESTPNNTEHPCSAFWTDLRPILQDWATQGNQIIMGLDANEDIWTPEIRAFFHKFGMSESIIVAHGQEAPPTHNRAWQQPNRQNIHNPSAMTPHVRVPERLGCNQRPTMHMDRLPGNNPLWKQRTSNHQPMSKTTKN